MKKKQHILFLMLAMVCLVVGLSCSGGGKSTPNNQNKPTSLLDNPKSTDTTVSVENAQGQTDTENTHKKSDYGFDEAEIRQRLNERTAFHVAEFSLTIDAEKEKDFFEDFKVGQRQILLPVKANFKYLFYLDEMGEITCDEKGVIRLKLPPLHLQMESCSIVWDSIVDNRTLLRRLWSFTADEKARMRNDAAKCMAETAKKQVMYQKQAADKAEEVLRSIFSSLNYDNVIVYKTFDNRDIVDDIVIKLK